MKFQKNKKIQLYGPGNKWRDEWGTWHTGFGKVGSPIWACYQPVRAEAGGVNDWYEVASVKFTINKQKDIDISIATMVKFQGVGYNIVRIEDIHGETRGDVVLYCETDAYGTDLPD